MKNPPSEKRLNSRMQEVAKSCNVFAGLKLTKIELADLVRLLFRVTETKNRTSEATAACMRSLLPIENQILNASMIKRNCQRVLANWHFVDAGLEVPLWDGSKTPTAVAIIGMLKTSAHQDKYTFIIKLKTGLCSGIINCTSLWRRSLSTFLQHKAGVAKFNASPEEFSGMAVHATAEMLPDKLVLTEMTCTDADKKHNKELLTARRDIAKCSTPVPCNICQLNIKECPLAIWIPEDKEES